MHVDQLRTAMAVIAAMACASLEARPAAGAPAAAPDPVLAGFPPGYIQSCSARPKTAVTSAPPRFRPFMRVVCTKVSDALAPLPGFQWAFSNGTSGFLTALNAKDGAPSQPANFTRLTDAPLTPAEVAAFRDRLKSVVTNPAILAADVMRLEVDTSTNDHKQEYLLVGHDAQGAVDGVWGIECYNDCIPMEKTPWAFTVVPFRP